MTLIQQLEAQGAILFRRRSFVPFAILPFAIVAALASTSFPDGHAPLGGRIYDAACILISFFGLACRAYTVACAAPRTSGRNTHEQRADSLNTTGMYSIVRNPLYVANFIMFVGMLLFIKAWWLVTLATLAYILYYERIVMAEESYLLAKFGETYAIWANRTPAMIPNFRLWQKPERKFSLKIALRREYNGFYLIIAVFYVLEWGDRLLFTYDMPGPMTIGQMPGLYWNSFFIGGTLIFLILRTLKKYTSFLKV
jgi:protein-S-isoprenylcysteine O-methyltransferase Ste14